MGAEYDGEAGKGGAGAMLLSGGGESFGEVWEAER